MRFSTRNSFIAGMLRRAGLAAPVFFVFATSVFASSSASHTLCGEPAGWAALNQVYEQDGGFFQCTGLSASALNVNDVKQASLLALLAKFDTGYVQQGLSLPDDLADQIGAQSVSINDPYYHEWLIRNLLIKLENMAYREAASLAAEAISRDVFAGSAYENTVRLIYLQSTFSIDQYDKVKQICTSPELLASVKNNQQEAVFYGFCGFNDVLSEDSSIRESGYAQLQLGSARIMADTDPHLCAQINNGLASYFQSVADLPRTEQLLEEGIACLPAPENLQQQEMLDDLTNNLAWVYRHQGKLPEYLATLRESVYRHTYNLAPEKLIVSYANLGRAYMLVGDIEKSERYYQQVLQVSNAENFTTDFVDTLISLAGIAISKNDLASAQSWLDELAPLQRTRLQESRYEVLFARIRARLSPAEFDEDACVRALGHLTGQYSVTQRSQLMSDWLEVLLLVKRYGMAKTLIEDISQHRRMTLSVSLALANARMTLLKAGGSEHLPEIAGIFYDAFASITEASTKFSSNETGMSWLSQSRRLINNYLSAILPSDDERIIEEALFISERFSAIVFNRHRMALASQSYEKVDETLQSEWMLANAAMPDPQSSADNDDEQFLKDKLWERVQLAGQQRELSDSEPVQTFSLDKIRQSLGNKRAILKILALENKSCAYLISGPYIEQQCAFSPDALTAWISGRLTEYHGFKTLYLLPEGPWRNSSFAALNDKTGTRYLGFEMGLVRILSLMDYQSAGDENSAAGNIVAFTNPSNPSPEYMSDSEAMQWRAGFPPLPWTARAADVLATSFPTVPLQVFTGDDATNESITSAAARDASLLHVGSHAWYSPESPETVGLVTATGDENEHQGYISYENLFSHVFHNRLVVISACETEMGKSYQGIGMRSLSHGFLYQGAGATISTLWKVPDRATAEFMQHFYVSLAGNGGDIADAMRNARVLLASKRRFRDPRYWGAFVFTVTGPDYEFLSLEH